MTRSSCHYALCRRDADSLWHCRAMSTFDMFDCNFSCFWVIIICWTALSPSRTFTISVILNLIKIWFKIWFEICLSLIIKNTDDGPDLLELWYATTYWRIRSNALLLSEYWCGFHDNGRLTLKPKQSSINTPLFVSATSPWRHRRSFISFPRTVSLTALPPSATLTFTAPPSSRQWSRWRPAATAKILLVRNPDRVAGFQSDVQRLRGSPAKSTHRLMKGSIRTSYDWLYDARLFIAYVTTTSVVICVSVESQRRKRRLQYFRHILHRRKTD